MVAQYHSDESAARDVVSAIEDDGGRAIARQCDVSDRAEVRALFADVRDSLGDVDVLVNNAALGPRDEPFRDRDPAAIERKLAVNVAGAMDCVQEVIDGMCEQEWGRIVNVASTAGAHGSSSDPVYGASKGGLIAFTKSLAKQHAADGIRSNAVAPSITDTPMLPQERRDAAVEVFPEGRIVQPDDVASAVRYLVSEAYDCGKVLEVAGGRYL